MPAREAWLFPELDRSFKQVFVLQMFAVLVLLGVISSQFGWLWGTVGGAVATLVWCAMIQAGINSARNRQISVETAERLAASRGNFNVLEGRLLPREQMNTGPALPARPALSMDDLPSPDEYGR